MPYSITTWVEGTTGITAARLNNIESGVEVGYNNAILYAAATGSANAYIVALSPAPAALTEGMCIAVKINVDSTGVSTINVNGLSAKGIKKANGNDVTNLKAGGIYTLRYNGVNFQLLGEGGEYGTAGTADVKVGVTFGTENGVVTGTFTSDATAVASDIIANKTAYVAGNKVTGTIPDRGAGGIKTPTASNITLSAGRYTTDIVIAGVSVPAANVLTGTTIAGTAGTMPNAAGDTASLASSISGTTLKLRSSKGYRDGVDDNVTITDANFIAGNIPNTKSIFGLQGTLVLKPYGVGDQLTMAQLGLAGDYVSTTTNASIPAWAFTSKFVGSHIYLISTADGKVQKRNDTTSGVIWEATLAHNTKKVCAVDGSGNLFILTSPGTTGSTSVLYKYNTSGVEQWHANIRVNNFSTSLYLNLCVSYSGNYMACGFDEDPAQYVWRKVCIVNSTGTVLSTVGNTTLFIDDSGSVIGPDGPNSRYCSFYSNGTLRFTGTTYSSFMGSVDGTGFLTLGWEGVYTSDYTCRVNCGGGIISYGLIVQGTVLSYYDWGQIYSAASDGGLKKYYIYGTSWSRKVPNIVYGNTFRCINSTGTWGIWTPYYFSSKVTILS